MTSLAENISFSFTPEQLEFFQSICKEFKLGFEYERASNTVNAWRSQDGTPGCPHIEMLFLVRENLQVSVFVDYEKEYLFVSLKRKSRSKNNNLKFRVHRSEGAKAYQLIEAYLAIE